MYLYKREIIDLLISSTLKLFNDKRIVLETCKDNRTWDVGCPIMNQTLSIKTNSRNSCIMFKEAMGME